RNHRLRRRERIAQARRRHPEHRWICGGHVPIADVVRVEDVKNTTGPWREVPAVGGAERRFIVHAVRQAGAWRKPTLAGVPLTAVIGVGKLEHAVERRWPLVILLHFCGEHRRPGTLHLWNRRAQVEWTRKAVLRIRVGCLVLVTES